MPNRLVWERAHGVPAWCMELLRDMLDKQQLLVLLDIDLDSDTRRITPHPSLLADFSARSKGRRQSEGAGYQVSLSL